MKDISFFRVLVIGALLVFGGIFIFEAVAAVSKQPPGDVPYVKASDKWIYLGKGG